MSTENEKIKVHPNWLRFMYAYTIVIGGVFGLTSLILPSAASSLMGFPTEEPIIAGLASSVGVAFAILSIAGLRSPPEIFANFTSTADLQSDMVHSRYYSKASSRAIAIIRNNDERSVCDICNRRPNRYTFPSSPRKVM